MSILKNAIDSIVLGLEDYETSKEDDRRIISSTRNIYAGILLLFKHKLSSLSAKNTDEALIKERVSPKIIDNQILWVGKGKKTVDYQSIKDRFDSLGIAVDWSRIEKINDYRNNVEHYFSNLEHKSIQGLISNSFIIIRDFISEQLQHDPKELLGNNSWLILVDIHEVHEKEKQACIDLIKITDFFNDTIQEAFISHLCKECGSDLIYPREQNIEAAENIFVCKSCDTEFYYEEIVNQAIINYYEHESYVAITDGGNSPIADCPFCGGTYLYEDNLCAVCGESASQECDMCGGEILPEELSDSNLCGYCSHKMSKDD